MSRTHYSTLGVEPTAARETIKKAYYDLRKQFFKLKRPTEPQKERLVRINAAWDVLKLADRRQAYDAKLGIGGDNDAETEADHDYQESLRRTAAARKAASDAAAAAAERRAAAAAAERQAKKKPAQPPTPPPADPETPNRMPFRKFELPGGAKYWAMGGGFAVAYLALSAAIQRHPPPAPTPQPTFIEASAPRKAGAAARPSHRHSPRQRRHGAHQQHSMQNAADLNRLELERLRSSSPVATPSAIQPAIQPFRQGGT